MKKVVDIPESVTLPVSLMLDEYETLKKGQNIGFVRFLTMACQQYKKFAQGPEMARQYQQIRDVIDGVNGEKSICFGESDFAVVNAAVQESDWGSPDLNAAFIPFYAAVEKVQDVKEGVKDKKE